MTGNRYDRAVQNMNVLKLHVPYPRERGPMGSAPYTGPRLGDGPIFEVSVSHLDLKEQSAQVSYPCYLHA